MSSETKPFAMFRGAVSGENKPLLLTDKETAVEFGISRPTLWRWRKTVPNFPQPIKVGPRAVRYRRADIVAFIEAGGAS
ncbi:helix-turn-helix domain-containing protein [Aeromonas encheleia]|uniref:helix-turn-helix transcriptional regulator n=1 Tax=Aeromonas encheleia TaxID=73010 RepID=UPI001F5837D6|nr:helix-turn-helix domain-containing protein [Aeromonas encheleia]UNP89645.1 helix-turn-helix domain-containing protein [Aeromonas encheleia]